MTKLGVDVRKVGPTGARARPAFPERCSRQERLGACHAVAAAAYQLMACALADYGDAEVHPDGDWVQVPSGPSAALTSRLMAAAIEATGAMVQGAAAGRQQGRPRR